MRSQAAKEGHEVAQLLEGKVSRKVKIICLVLLC